MPCPTCKKNIELIINLYNINGICSICLDEFENPVALNCGHGFCEKCLNKYTQGKIDSNKYLTISEENKRLKQKLEYYTSELEYLKFDFTNQSLEITLLEEKNIKYISLLNEKDESLLKIKDILQETINEYSIKLTKMNKQIFEKDEIIKDLTYQLRLYEKEFNESVEYHKPLPIKIRRYKPNPKPFELLDQPYKPNFVLLKK